MFFLNYSILGKSLLFNGFKVIFEFLNMGKKIIILASGREQMHKISFSILIKATILMCIVFCVTEKKLECMIG